MGYWLFKELLVPWGSDALRRRRGELAAEELEESGPALRAFLLPGPQKYHLHIYLYIYICAYRYMYI